MPKGKGLKGGRIVVAGEVREIPPEPAYGRRPRLVGAKA